MDAPSAFLTDIKQKLWAESHRCFYCGKGLSFRKATLDHVIPVIRGGKTELENLVLACSICNNQKGHKTVSDFMAHRQKQKRRKTIAIGTPLAIKEIKTPPPKNEVDSLIEKAFEGANKLE